MSVSDEVQQELGVGCGDVQRVHHVEVGLAEHSSMWVNTRRKTTITASLFHLGVQVKDLGKSEEIPERRFQDFYISF